MAKKGQKFTKYSPEFKLSVILDMRENNLGYGEVVRKYWNLDSYKEAVFIGCIQSNTFSQIFKYQFYRVST